VLWQKLHLFQSVAGTVLFAVLSLLVSLAVAAAVHLMVEAPLSGLARGNRRKADAPQAHGPIRQP
jgi:peptidoglycan/LPS O-acetylase OafA/YrhL